MRRALASVLSALLLLAGCAAVREPELPYRAVQHLKLLRDAREKAVEQYIKEQAWIGLTKAQMEEVLRLHGFPRPYRYGPVYEDWWGSDYDEALMFRQSIDDLWIMFKDGKVAKVATIYRE